VTSERWRRLQDLFDNVMQSPPEERDSRLQEVESELRDDALFRELRRLVLHAEPESGFLDPIPGAETVARLVRTEGIQPGTLVEGRFEILRPLGRGGMGEVFEAQDRVLRERVAIKTIGPELARDAKLIERFHREVRVARRVTHPNICRIHDFGEHEGTPFLSMELLEGETLAKRLERGPLSSKEWDSVARQLFEALRAAHAAGVIHRDLKPSNLMMSADRLVVLDFGLACPVLPAEEESLTRTGALMGTLDWMAPEQLQGDSDERSDLYSAALILVAALQERPFPGNTRGLAGALRRATGDTDFRILLPEGLPRRRRAMLLQCLERDPKRRSQSAAEVLASLTERAAIRPWRVSRRLRGPLAAGAGILILMMSLFAVGIRYFQYPGLKPGSLILVATTVNATGEGRLDGMTSVLRASLEQSSKYNVWDANQRLGTVLRTMRRSPESTPDTRDWREIAYREQVPLVVFSTVSPSGDGYVLTIHCEQTGKDPQVPVGSRDHMVRAAGPNGLFEAAREAVAWIRKTAGEEMSDIAAYNRLPQEITSSSWEALELFGRSQVLSASGRAAEAIPVLRRSVELDPGFAMAYMRLGDILNAQRQTEEGFSCWRMAISLARSQHLSKHEQLNIESRYAIEIGDFAKAEPVLREWVFHFPNDPLGYQLLASCLLDLGRYPEAIDLARKAQASFSPTVFGVGVLIRSLAAGGRGKELEAPLTFMDRLSPTWALEMRGVAAAMRDDYPGAERYFRQLASAQQDPQMVSRAASLLSVLTAERGDFAGAAGLLRDGISRDRLLGEDGFASQKAAGLAFVESIRGDIKAARAWALEAASADSSPQAMMLSASTLARLGFIEDATQIMERFPAYEGPVYDSARLRIRGELLAAQGNYVAAVGLLERASRLSSAQDCREYLARVFDLAGEPERARMIYDAIANTPWCIWHAPEYEWPGVRFLAKTYIHSRKGK